MQSKTSQKPSILVVDDDPDILDFLHDFLELEGYKVAVSLKGEYLETLHNENLPDLILLDVHLSGWDGREIVRHLKKREETKQIPIIMISAHPNAEKTARQAGADAFLEKPFQIEVLLEMIAYWLLPFGKMGEDTDN
jgi:CheY-like chemotaxis protein